MINKITLHSAPLLRRALRILLIFSLLHFACSRLFAQNPKVDSINRLIANEKADTTRIKLNIDKINLLAQSDLNAAITLGKEQLAVADKLNYYFGIVRLRSQLAGNYIFTGDYQSALQNIHFLEKFIKPKDSMNYSGILATYGMMYGVKGVYDSSIMYYAKTIELNERLHNNIELPGNYTNIAIGYQQLANYPMALKYQQKGLALTQKNGNKSMEARTMMNMAITYQNIGDTAKAIEMYEASVQLAKETKSRITELYGYSNLSTIYLGKREWTKAYDYAMKSADIANSSGDIGILAASLSKAAMSLAYQNKFSEATELSQRAIALADSSSQPMNISQAYNAMAITLYLQKKYKEAIPFFERNFQTLGGSVVYDLAFGESYKFLSKCYEATGNFKKALENYQLGVDISDSMRRKDNIRKATELSMNYEFEKKQEVQNAEQKLKDSIAHSKQIALLVGLGIFLLLSVLAFIGYKNKQKANAMLKAQKQQIEHTLDQLKSTQSQLIQSEKMASLGELTAGIAHEIQNPLNFVNNFSEVSTELIDEMKEELATGNEPSDSYRKANEIADDLKQNLEKINHHGKRAGDIVKGMLEHSRRGTGQKEMTDINALCDEYLRLSYHGMKAKDKSFNAVPIAIGMKTDFDTTIPKINVVPQDIGRVILNLINNAFYAVNEKKNLRQAQGNDYQPTVSITTKKTDKGIEIKVADNGNGIPKNIVDKIFQPFFTTKPTGQGTGLGLSLSYDIVKVHGGEIFVNTRESEGTDFIISLPAYSK